MARERPVGSSSAELSQQSDPPLRPAKKPRTNAGRDATKEKLTSAKTSKNSRQLDHLLRPTQLPRADIDLESMRNVLNSLKNKTSALYNDDMLFMERILPHLKEARTSEERKSALAEARSAGKDALAREALYQTTHPMPIDVCIVHDSDEMTKALGGDIRLIHASSAALLTRASPHLDIEALIQSVHGEISVYDPCSESSELATKRFLDGPEIFRKAFTDPDCVPMNFLDIQNNTGHTFFPREILKHDLTYLIRQKEFRASQRKAGRNPTKQLELDPEWILATHGPMVSAMHVDSAGVCTATVMVMGCKHWLVPRGAPIHSQRLLALKGSRSTMFGTDVANIKLEAGSVLIQGPGVPHAVFSPGDCVLAGYFFWTAETFDATMQCLLLRKDLANDDIKPDQWRQLQKIVDYLDDDEFFNRDQRCKIASAMMDDIGILGVERMTGHKGNSRSKDRGEFKSDPAKIRPRQSQDQSEESIAEEKVFLGKCASWLCRWLEY